MLAPGSASLIAKELARAKVSIMALQEVRWPDAGEFVAEGYTFLWSGPAPGTPRSAGVSLALDRDAYRAMTNWRPVNERIILADFKHTFGKLHVVAAYAPPDTATAAQKDAFYAVLDQVTSTFRTGLVLCLGDFNAVPGDDRTLAPQLIGPFCYGTPNDNTDRFINFCLSNCLRICGTWFRRPDIHRQSWYSNDGRTAKEIDHILVNTRWNAVQQCRVYRSMEFDTDHLPVVARVVLKLKRVMPRATPHPRYDLRKLEDPAFQQLFAVEVSNRFAALSEEDKSDWQIFKENFNKVATSNPGIAKPAKKPWISQSSLDLIEEKRSARLLGRTSELKRLTKLCRANIRQDKQKWADDIANEAEADLTTGRMKDAFSNLRRLRSAGPRISSPISLPDGTLVSDRRQKLMRWKDHYSDLLNRQHITPPADLLDEAANAHPDESISCDPPTLAEVHAAISRLKNGKAPGICNIPPELLKAAGPSGVEWLTAICAHAWTTGHIPDDWRRGVILPFYKGKGSRHDCSNYRGITLLSVPGKVFAHVLLSRVRERLRSHRRVQQSGFTPHRSTIDRIITLQLLLQTRREFCRPLWIAYVDLKAAFDSVNREALWLLLLSLGLPPKLVNLFKALYTDTLSCVRADGCDSDWFPIGSGVRQGCVVAPDLFLTPMDRLLSHTNHLAFLGTTIGTEPFTDLDFADDVALLTEMLSVLVLALETMNDEAKSLGLQINWSKTKIQTTDATFSPGGLVPVAGDNVEVVESFTYLGVNIHNTGSSEHDIRKRIAIARNCMASLDRNIWHSSISLSTKLRLYRVFILPVILYGAETWSPTRQLARNLDAFDQWCLRRMLRISWRDRISNEEVRQRTDQPPLTDIIRTTRLKFFGHIARADPSMDHSRALRASVAPLSRDWNRRAGRPRQTWLRTIESDLAPLNIGLVTAYRRAQNRQAWSKLIGTATSSGQAT